MVAPELSDHELRLLRMHAQRLLPSSETRSVSDAAAKALAIQAQDVPAATLAVGARTSGLTAEVIHGRAARKAVCRSWLMRNTIHLFETEDLAWMRPLLAERSLGPARRRLDQLGLEEGTVESLLESLRRRLAEGPLPRSEARELIAAQGIEPGDNNQRVYWLLHVAAIRGVLVIRPALEQKQTFEAAPSDHPLDRAEAYGRLAHRFLSAYGPATPPDFAYWGKLKITDARLGWEGAGELVEIATERGMMSALAEQAEPLPLDDALVRLLPVWDNYLLGYKDREFAVPSTHARMPGAGKATAFLDGHAFGHWRIEREKGSIAVVVEPFGPLPRDAKPGLEAEVARLGRFFETEATLRIER